MQRSRLSSLAPGRHEQTPSTATSWSVSWRPAGERVDQVWNGTVTTQGGLVVVGNVAWNGQLSAGGTTTFGLLGSGTPPTPALTCTSS